MGVVYSDNYPTNLHQLMYWSHTKYPTMEFLVSRQYEYKTEGRNQTSIESDNIHDKIVSVLNNFSLAHSNISGNEDGLQLVTDLVIKNMERNNG